jgi:alkylation response protein AidB-like acyl-CoA dehydrogenase
MSMTTEKEQSLEIAEEARKHAYELPSFGAQLFMGTFDPSLLHPFPQQTPEEIAEGDAIINPFMNFLYENLDPEEVDATRTIPQAVLDEMARMGIFALKIPKKYGGLGLSQVNYNRLVMKVASYCGSTAVLISAHQSIGVPQPLKMYGTEQQRQKYFPKFREGWISAFALTEPDVGSDPAKMDCEAKLSPDGSHYILNGEKLWCTNGPLADVIVVMARTAPKIVKGVEKKQISAFILETNTPGVEVTQRCEFMGLGGIYNGMFRFKNVKIPKENLLWEEGRGLALALGTINVGRLTLPATAVAAGKQCLAIARMWGKNRVQWGSPIGLHEPGREKITHIAASTFAMEAMTWICSHWADESKVDIRIEAAMAKLFCSETAWDIIDETIQLRGGRGYEKGRSLAARGEPNWPLERMMRDARISRILEGSTEIMRLFLAREALEPHLKMANPLMKKSSFGSKLAAVGKMLVFYAGWYPMQWIKSLFPGSFSDKGKLAKHYRYIKRTSHKLARAFFHSMLRYGPGLVNRQLILGRLVENGTDLFAMACACSYASSLKDQSAIELADFFCRQAERRINDRFHHLHRNDDRQSNAIAKQVLAGDFEWLEKGVAPLEPMPEAPESRELRK